jgi:hypothetical protein
MMVRQGDLLIVKVGSIPEKAIKKAGRVLAEGEATGHLHELDNGVVYEHKGTLFFRVSETSTATLTHQEHGPVTFKAGEYKVIRQREYEPNGWRQVAD